MQNTQAFRQNSVWHPCTSMKNDDVSGLLRIKNSEGSILTLENGKQIIDGISSWWCKSLGHNHPRLKAALQRQLERFEHVMPANTTYDKLEELSEKLTTYVPYTDKVFYAGDGACAVEIALKMSVHARVVQGQDKKRRFITLKNSYHGETLGALSVSGAERFRSAYTSMLFKPHVIEEIPYVTGKNDPLWQDCQSAWHQIEPQLDQLAETATALIVEPIVQGAGGMLLYSQDFLKRLVRWAKQHDIHLIADEIMTGVGRTGKFLASEHADIQPDFVCLSKGLTSGWLPLSAVLTTHEIYDVLHADQTPGRTFVHSHTHSGNALAVSVALETLKIIEAEKLCERANDFGYNMYSTMQDIAKTTGKLENVRGIGAIAAADMVSRTGNAGQRFAQEALKRGALLRPIGKTIYWLPPLTIAEETLTDLMRITAESLGECFD